MTGEAPRITVAQVCDTLDRYINTHGRSQDVAERWLTKYLTDVLLVCRQVRNGNLRDCGLQQKVNAFRVEEIEKQKQSKLREVEELDREAKQLAKIERV